MSDVSSSTPSLTPHYGNSTLVFSTCTKQKISPSGCILSKCQSREQGAEAIDQSAAKRESAMALGSIEHYFTKTGLIAKESNAQRKGLVPAIESFSAHIKGNPLLSGLPELDIPLLPALPARSFPPFMPYVKTFEVSFKNLQPGGHSGPFGRRTGGAEQRLRRAAYSQGDNARDPLCPESPTLPPRRARPHTTPAGFRSTSLSTSEPQKRRAFSGTDRTDPLACIRRAALDVLTLLRELEKSARVPLSYDAGSDRRVGLSLRHAVWTKRRMSSTSTRSEWLPRERWDEWFMRSSGWPYKQDFKIEDIEKQRGGVAQYLDIDEVLFRGSRTSGLGIRAGMCDAEGETRAIRDLVMEEPEELQILVEENGNENEGDGDETSGVVEDHLPRWSRWSTFPDNPLMRTYVLLVAFLLTSLLHHLPGSQDRAEFLNPLSSGQSLCLAIINTDSIHDIIALEAALTRSEVDGSQEEKGRKGWTFRRTDHLRLWGAAGTIRYILPIISPATPNVPTLKPNPTGDAMPPSPSSSKFSEPPVFDARGIARPDDGLEGMLECVHVVVARHLLITFCPSARLPSYLLVGTFFRVAMLESTLQGKIVVSSFHLGPTIHNMDDTRYVEQLSAQGVSISERHSASRTQGTMHAHTLVSPDFIQHHVVSPPYLTSDPPAAHQRSPNAQDKTIDFGWTFGDADFVKKSNWPQMRMLQSTPLLQYCNDQVYPSDYLRHLFHKPMPLRYAPISTLPAFTSLFIFAKHTRYDSVPKTLASWPSAQLPAISVDDPTGWSAQPLNSFHLDNLSDLASSPLLPAPTRSACAYRGPGGIAPTQAHIDADARRVLLAAFRRGREAIAMFNGVVSTTRQFHAEERRADEYGFLEMLVIDDDDEFMQPRGSGLSRGVLRRT
ncbi:hypothetical protein EDB85DRAFT_1898221 [Lactarius pseudohatsudake]|nr:hypothetical protein EDB85DRAFT_1898221 [Lactarius pseudohatsudake]